MHFILISVCLHYCKMVKFNIIEIKVKHLRNFQEKCDCFFTLPDKYSKFLKNVHLNKPNNRDEVVINSSNQQSVI